MSYNIKDKQLFNISLRLDGMVKGGLESFQSSDALFIIESFQEIIRKEDDIISILATLVVGIVGSVIATYIVRFVDKKLHKNNRHESK